MTSIPFKRYSILREIKNNNSKEDVLNQIDEQKLEYLDEGWKEEFEDENEAYEETGRGEAENDILMQLIDSIPEGKQISDIDKIIIFDELVIYYELIL